MQLASRRFPLAAAVVLLLATAAAGQAEESAQIVLSEQTLTSGEAGTLRVTLTSTGPGISGVQFDLEFDHNVLDILPQASPRLESAAKSVASFASTPDTNRVLIIGLNQNPIPGGIVVELAVKARAGVPEGIYPVRLREAIAVDAEGTEVPVSTRDGALTIGSAAQTIDNVRNAASLGDGSIAPGELVSIMGSGFTEQTTVLVNETPAVILFLHPRQINAVVPFTLPTMSLANVVVTGPTGRASFDVPVFGASPGIFTTDATGSGPGAVLNENLTINSQDNPAPGNSVIAIYLTGAGQTEPLLSDGSIIDSISPRLVLPVKAEIGGTEAEVLYAGPAPGMIAGVFQINVRVPDSIAAGAASVYVYVGEANSQAGVIAYIQ